MNPSGRKTQPFGLSNQTGNSQKMASSNRFHPYTTSVESSNAFGGRGGRLPHQSSSDSPYHHGPPASPLAPLGFSGAQGQASLQNGTLQRFNMPGGNASINYQNPHLGSVSPRSVAPQSAKFKHCWQLPKPNVRQGWTYTDGDAKAKLRWNLTG